MKIVTTFHQPSSILSSLKCQLSSRDLEHLVVAKVNRIDVFSLQPHGLQHECGLEVWGKVVTVKSLPIAGSSRSNLVLMIAHPDPELVFLAYNEPESGNGELIVKKQLSLYERAPRPAEFFNDLLVHPSGKLAVASCYAGKLKIINLKAGAYAEDFDVLLPELNVFSLTFLPDTNEDYPLAILHIDYQDRVQLLARNILVDDLELSTYPSAALPPTSIPAKILPFPTDSIPRLISVPAGAPKDFEDDDDQDEDDDKVFLGGVMIVGGRKILLYELASAQKQAKQTGKRRRMEKGKKSGDVVEVAKAKEKEKEREARFRKARGSVDWPWSDVTAFCAVDQYTSKYFIGDAFGRLALLSVDQLDVHGLILLPLGETSSPTTITYLTTQTLFLGSHFGDSQLINVSSTPTSALTSPTLPIPTEIKPIQPARLSSVNSKGKGKAIGDASDDARDPTKGSVIDSQGSFINVLETFKNIAPIVDAVLADTDGSGQRQIITCSGGGNSGSINIVRNGADFQELASIPGLAGATNIWGVRDQFQDTSDTHILISTLHASYLLRINDRGHDTTLVHVKETGSLVTNLSTLAFGNVARRVTTSGKASYVNSQLVVQVTRQGAFLHEYDLALGMYVHRATWGLEGMEVVAASLNPSQVVLAFSGGKLVALSIAEGDAFRVVVESKPGAYFEMSTVSCAPLDPSKFFSTYITVSYWDSNEVEIFLIDREGFVSVSKSAPLPALVRSILLYNFGIDHSSKGEDYHPHLIAGLADGSLVFIPWKDRQLKDQTIISLGHAPVSLTPCQVDGKRTVFAAGNRATVLSWEKKRLHNSPIMLKEIVAVSCLNTPTFESSLVLGTATGFFIGRVRDLDKMHIRSIPFGLDNPRRIAYEPSLKVFGVACNRVEPGRIGDPESSRSSFKLMDDTTFSSLADFKCEIDEELSALTAFSPTINDKTMPFFCLGSFTYEAEEKEPTKGRLMIFTAYTSNPQNSSNLQLSLVAEAKVKGCVYSITIIDDMIVASVNSAVMLYRLKSSETVPSSAVKLELLSEWNHNYLVTSIASYGNYIVAGDQISSVSLLQVVDSKLQNVARDYGPLWPVCVEASDEENIIGANDALNLFTFTLSRSLGRAVLERDGSYHLADFVNKFIRGSLTSSDSPTKNDALEAKHIFFTSAGRIGVIVDVADPQLSIHMTALQRNLASVLPGVGGVTHTRFRAPKSTRGRSDADDASFGFIDGDFLEQFLAHLGSPERIEEIIAGTSEPERLTMPIEEMQKVLENLQSMH